MKYLLALIAYMSVFSSCSAIKLARDYAGWYINSEVDDAFDLNDAQEEHIEKSVEQHLVWFDQEFVPEIVRFADLVLLESRKDLKEQGLEELFNQFGFLREMLVTRISDDAGYLLSDLTKDQQKVFESYLAKRAEKSEERNKLKDDEFAEELWDDRFENLEDWFGDLSDENKATIKKIWPIDRESQRFWQANRTVRNNAIIGLVGMKPEKIKSTIIAWAKNPETFYDKETQLTRAKYKVKTNTVILQVFAALTPTQKIFFRKKVQKLRDDLASLKKKEPEGSL